MQTDRQQLEYFERSFTNLTPDEDTIALIEATRADYKSLAATVIQATPGGRCRSLALTNLETSLMYAVKGLVGVDDHAGPVT